MQIHKNEKASEYFTRNLNEKASFDLSSLFYALL